MDDKILISVENLSKNFAVRNRIGRKTVLHAVDGVSFQIARGETLGLVGESGCGKTTLGRTILRLLEPDGGRILYDGTDITRVNMRPYRSKMQIIFQDPAGSLDPRSQICDIVAEGLCVTGAGLSRGDRASKVTELLEKVGLDGGIARRYPHEFSGGQQQRIGIARALAVNPEFIVCDEPVSALDVSYQSQIITLLEQMQENMNLTYMFISHDLSVVRHISDRIGVMYLGRIVELGGGVEIGVHAAHPYTRSLLTAVPVPDPQVSRAREQEPIADIQTDGGIPSQGCRFHASCPHAMPVCAVEEPQLREIAPNHLCACHLHAAP
ncbi:MAG: ABC transporter ATP-binding protein [Oscillospiraceae bacterium]|jgi:oligopeptide transport system ATP-binding protein|nr:ABC transporter ATP-binding protein [Oscillospiraceae bacterium]